MKKCTKCQTQNSDESNFCDQCGQPLTTKENQEEMTNDSSLNETRAKDVKKNRQTLGIGLIVVVIGIIVGIFIFIAFKPSNEGESASKSAQSSTETSTKSTKEQSSQTQSSTSHSQETESDKNEIENYDAIIKEAKELNIDGKYKESELKLAAIPVSALGKSEYSTIKEAAEKLTNSNNEGLQKQKEASNSNSNSSSNATQTPTASSTFVGDLAKWANTYTFYYSQDGQKQSRLTIAANGGVTQSNYDGTQYFGQATIEPGSGSILSYNTDTQYPFRMPSTKMINANVVITIQWDNGGGSQVLYGYLSYSSRLALTDGLNKGGGVNEVWITY